MGKRIRAVLGVVSDKGRVGSPLTALAPDPPGRLERDEFVDFLAQDLRDVLQKRLKGWLGLGGDLQRPEAKRLGLGSVTFGVHEVRALK